MSTGAYTRYKRTDAPWLSQIPDHWELRRLKNLCDVIPSNVDKKTTDGETPVRLCNYTDVYYNDRIVAAMPLMEATASEAQIVAFTLRAGDTIITKDSETPDDIAVSAYVPEDLPGVVCGYHLCVVRPRAGTYGAFVKRFFDSAYARAAFCVRANGLTRYGLAQSDIATVPVPLPPYDEQVTIAAFLDHEARSLDSLIADQQRLIALLQEKRQALISHAVTKGLNPDAPMKASGIEWLGNVPAHWRITLLKRLFRSVDYGISESLASEGKVAILRMGNIEGGEVLLNDLKFVEHVDSTLLLQPGDLLYNRTNSLDLIGKVGLFRGGSERAVSFASYLVRLRTSDAATPEYLRYLLNIEELLAVARADAFVAIGQCNLNPSRYGHIRVAVPPLDEQVAIFEHLNGATEALDSLAAEARRAVSLLEERRTALISAAVTGQIDVRHAAELQPA